MDFRGYILPEDSLIGETLDGTLSICHICSRDKNDFLYSYLASLLRHLINGIMIGTLSKNAH